MSSSNFLSENFDPDCWPISLLCQHQMNHTVDLPLHSFILLHIHHAATRGFIVTLTLIESYQTLPLWIRLYLGAMVMKGYSTCRPHEQSFIWVTYFRPYSVFRISSTTLEKLLRHSQPYGNILLNYHSCRDIR